MSLRKTPPQHVTLQLSTHNYQASHVVYQEKFHFFLTSGYNYILYNHYDKLACFLMQQQMSLSIRKGENSDSISHALQEHSLSFHRMKQ